LEALLIAFLLNASCLKFKQNKIKMYAGNFNKI
jgi:hypothetical protein